MRLLWLSNDTQLVPASRSLGPLRKVRLEALPRPPDSDVEF